MLHYKQNFAISKKVRDRNKLGTFTVKLYQESALFFICHYYTSYMFLPVSSILGWVEKLKMSKMYYGHKVPVVIHKNEDISLFTF